MTVNLKLLIKLLIRNTVIVLEVLLIHFGLKYLLKIDNEYILIPISIIIGTLIEFEELLADRKIFTKE